MRCCVRLRGAVSPQKYVPKTYHSRSGGRSQRLSPRLLARPHHCDVCARPDDDRLDRNDAIVRRARETEEPLTSVRGSSELVRLRRRCPYIRTPARRPQVCVDGLVVARYNDACLPSKRKRESGSRVEKNQDSRDEKRIPHKYIIRHTSYAILLYMQWLRTHPYASALGAAALLVLVGAYVVVSRAIQPAGTSPTAWGGEAVPLLNPTSYGPTQNSQQGDDVMRQVQDGPPS